MDLIVSALALLVFLPITLVTALTGLKIYSWGRQLLLEKEKETSVQDDK